MNSEQEQKQAAPEQADNNVDIKFDGKKLIVSIPIAIGKIGVYGGLRVAEELASKIFYNMERQALEAASKNQSIIQKLKLH